jgi:excisionase family DNA binding protein
MPAASVTKSRANARLLSIPEVAQLLSLKEITIRKWMEQRRIAYVRLGRRVAISELEISRIIEAGSVPALASDER